MEYGVIGEHLKHSFSKEIHAKIGDYKYEIKEISRDDLDAFMKEKDFSGINVTIPYKETVIPYLDYIDPTAEAIGAVNTIVNENGKLYGYNTDVYGLKSLILKTGTEISGKTVLVFGSGGTSKTAVYTANMLGAEKVYTVSREKKQGCITYAEAKKVNADVIINTTPAGMYPSIYNQPDDISLYPTVQSVIDAIYNPIRSELVFTALQQGKIAEGGLYMLVSQALYAAVHFKKATVADLDRIYNQVLFEKENIVLTGMPGSGKTTVGRLISQKLGFDFIDTDDIITERYGKISDIFEKYGEAHFREIESEIIKEVSLLNGSIVATGGGAVLNPENIKNLKRNGKIYFIDRSLDDILPTSDRPLSSDREALEKRYNERYDTYVSTADVHMISASTAEETAERLVNDKWK